MLSKSRKNIGKKKILIVDDEHYFLKACKRYLMDSFTVKALNSGKAAIILLQIESDFDVIFLDVGIPDLPGIKVFEYIKNHHPELIGKVVFVTAGVFDQETQNLLNETQNVKLEKPFDLDDLVEQISRVTSLG